MSEMYTYAVARIRALKSLFFQRCDRAADCVSKL